MSPVSYLSSLAILLGIVSAASDVSLQKRGALLESRQTTCRNPAWIPACLGLFSCVPPGAICCSDSIFYAIPPETCPDGTVALTTAEGGGVVPTSVAPPPTTIATTIATTSTTSFTATQTMIEYTYFTYEITWYYYYYYYIYYLSSSTLTSSEVTTTTVVSVQATDSIQATALLASVTATIIYPTPTQTATAVSGTPPAGTASSSEETTPDTSSPTSPATTSPAESSGGSISMRPSYFKASAGLGWALASMFAVPWLLLWL